MKTTKILSALGLALIISAVFSTSASAIDKKGIPMSVNALIHYRVNVIANIDKKLCNVYLVKLMDERGRLIAPAKVYKPGVTQYDFYESGRSVSGVRTATLVRETYQDHFICETELFTEPVTISGLFSSGQTYRFDLHPKMLGPLNEVNDR
ncbi:MAG: hypothetical protein NTW16_16335 [Bacteroidetes bacterium]|nr:hypothetical protein [Bacteroidota bacterium]